MLNFVICDDMPLSSKDIKNAIEYITNEYDIEYSLDIFDKTSDLIASMSNKKYDMFFIDIMMPEIKGYKLVKFIQMSCPFAITVLISMFETFGDVACSSKVDAYLYKSYNKDKMIIEVAHLIKKCADKKRTYNFRTTNSSIDVPICNIMYIESQKRELYLSMYDESKIKIYNETLKSIKQNVEFMQFYKCSRNCLINMDSIINFQIGKYYSIIIEFKNGETMKLSSSAGENFQNAYTEYQEYFQNLDFFDIEQDLKNLK